MNAHKVHRIVEYIRIHPQFPFDVMDVDEDIDNVLSYFRLYPELDEDERREVYAELRIMASEAQLAEIARLVNEGGLLNPASGVPAHS